MTTMTDAGNLIKVDWLGRVRASAAQRDALLEVFAASGLIGTQFAAQHGVKYPTFATWIQKRKRSTGQYAIHSALDKPRSFPLLLAEVEQLEPVIVSKLPVELILPGGASIAVRDEGATRDPAENAHCGE